MQGNVSGISASDDKSEDNTSIPGRGLKSYLEVTITGESSHFRAPAHCFPAGRNRTDGTQSDARHRTPYEILVLMGMPRDFDLPEKIKIQDGDTIWCKDGPVPVSEFEQTTDDIVVSDEAFRTMLGEHYCPTVVSRCFKQLIYQIQNKDF